jgi:acyl-CoA thioester hydrolase
VNPPASPPRRQKSGYFAAEADAPAPLVARVTHRVSFSEADAMGVLWHGRYAALFEQANEELGRRCGMGYADFHRAKLAAPVVQLHVDYFAPARLGEELEIVGRMIWTGGARINIEYEIRKADGTLAAAGYTVQMFINASGEALLASPPMLENCRARWRAGELR